jgi:hypothetical protein
MVMAAAKKTSGAITVGLNWTDRLGKKHGHRLAVVTNRFGDVVFLESFKGKIRAFKSLVEMSRTIPARQGIENARVRSHVLEFTSTKLKLLKAVEDIWHLSIPVAVGLRWKGATSLDAAAVEIVKSAWARLKEKLGSKAPPLPAKLQQMPRGNSPKPAQPPEAAGAPRPDWLTGVQYRLKYLAYYEGPFTASTTAAPRTLIAFQTDRRS